MSTKASDIFNGRHSIFQRGGPETIVLEESKGKPCFSWKYTYLRPRPGSAVWRPPKMSEASEGQVDTPAGAENTTETPSLGAVFLRQ